MSSSGKRFAVEVDIANPPYRASSSGSDSGGDAKAGGADVGGLETGITPADVDVFLLDEVPCILVVPVDARLCLRTWACEFFTRFCTVSSPSSVAQSFFAVLLPLFLYGFSFHCVCTVSGAPAKRCVPWWQQRATDPDG
jgi:hypothetical protein